MWRFTVVWFHSLLIILFKSWLRVKSSFNVPSEEFYDLSTAFVNVNQM